MRSKKLAIHPVLLACTAKQRGTSCRILDGYLIAVLYSKRTCRDATLRTMLIREN